MNTKAMYWAAYVLTTVLFGVGFALILAHGAAFVGVVLIATACTISGLCIYKTKIIPYVEFRKSMQETLDSQGFQALLDRGGVKEIEKFLSQTNVKTDLSLTVREVFRRATKDGEMAVISYCNSGQGMNNGFCVLERGILSGLLLYARSIGTASWKIQCDDRMIQQHELLDGVKAPVDVEVAANYTLVCIGVYEMDKSYGIEALLRDQKTIMSNLKSIA